MRKACGSVGSTLSQQVWNPLSISSVIDYPSTSEIAVRRSEVQGYLVLGYRVSLRQVHTCETLCQRTSRGKRCGGMGWTGLNNLYRATFCGCHLTWGKTWQLVLYSTILVLNIVTLPILLLFSLTICTKCIWWFLFVLFFLWFGLVLFYW